MKPLYLLALSLLAASDLGVAAPNPVIWKNPGAVENLDFVGGPGSRAGAPKVPFTFVEEDHGGTSPKVMVTDARGVLWSVKWGKEVGSETFASRMAWAAGYLVQPMYFVAHGKIQGVTDLKRAKNLIRPDGSFDDARFQLRDPRLKFLRNNGWAWNDNPFVGTRELNGLKIIVMLTSNWDNKDSRDADRGSNTAIFESRTQQIYQVIDWGGSMGKWGGVMERSKWDSAGFASQSSEFIEKVKGAYVKWGYQGQHTSDATENISVADLRWLLQFISRIRDTQLRAGLVASGATPAEANVFAAALRSRINQMRSAVRPLREVRH